MKKRLLCFAYQMLKEQQKSFDPTILRERPASRTFDWLTQNPLRPYEFLFVQLVEYQNGYGQGSE